MMIRVYYPISANNDKSSLYYRPTIEIEKMTLKSVPGMKSTLIDQITQLKSYAIRNSIYAYQLSAAHEQSKLAIGEDVIIQSALPTENQMNKINIPTYVIVKPRNIWRAFYYEPGKKKNEIDIQMISGLQTALNSLSSIKQITPSDKAKIKNIVDAYHQQYGNYLGKGNGIEITKAIDLYMVNFFNHFLKAASSEALQKCIKMSDNTFIECA